MQKLETIYNKAGLKKIKNYHEVDKFSYDTDNYHKVKLDKETFYINWDISKNLAENYGNKSEESNQIDEYFSLEKMIEEDVIYSSKIEGINIEKEDLKKDEESLKEEKSEYKDIFEEAYKYLFTQDEINHDVISELKDILSKSKLMEKDSMSGKKSIYRDGQVGIYKKVNGGDIKIHEGVEHTKIERYLDDVFKYLNSYERDGIFPQGVAIRVGVTHCLFEYIHPFFDGNGRVGRMLINWLIRRTSFPETSYFLSEIIQNNKSKYYVSLEDSQKSKDLSYHIAFIFAVMNESREIYSKLVDALEKTILSETQVRFLKKLLISGMNNTSVTYPEIKSRFPNHSRQSFHKMADKLISLGVLKKEIVGKTAHYSINK